MFGAPGTTSTLSVPDGLLAISVQLGDPERVAGFVAPGSDVTIFATVSGGTDGASEFTQVLLPEVQVIGVGTTTRDDADHDVERAASRPPRRFLARS